MPSPLSHQLKKITPWRVSWHRVALRWRRADHQKQRISLSAHIAPNPIISKNIACAFCPQSCPLKTEPQRPPLQPLSHARGVVAHAVREEALPIPKQRGGRVGGAGPPLWTVSVWGIRPTHPPTILLPTDPPSHFPLSRCQPIPHFLPLPPGGGGGQGSVLVPPQMRSRTLEGLLEQRRTYVGQ